MIRNGWYKIEKTYRTELMKIQYYQDRCRIYLDEYPEQEEIRNKWFAIFLSYKLNVTVDYVKWSKLNPLKLWLKILTKERLNEFNPSSIENNFVEYQNIEGDGDYLTLPDGEAWEIPGGDCSSADPMRSDYDD